MQDTVYGELQWQSENASAFAPLMNSVSTMLGRGLYFNQAQKHFQQLLLMEERATIARELHDSLAQVLSYLRIQLTLLKRSIPQDNDTAQSIMADFSCALNDAYQQLRELLTTFRLTLQQADLPSALREMLDTLQNQTSTVACQHWRWMRKCRCICYRLFVKRLLMRSNMLTPVRSPSVA